VEGYTLVAQFVIGGVNIRDFEGEMCPAAGLSGCGLLLLAQLDGGRRAVT